MQGPTSARVVGPEGEEIYCDEHGRVKLHFLWDRYSNGDERSSCWGGLQLGRSTIRHGGVHFTQRNVPWAKDKYPVRAIADGKVVACRLSSQYQETTYKDLNKELTLPFSHDFCLIEHEFLSKDETGTETKFVFYSLYMHLDPINFHQSLSPTKLYKFIKGGWYGREFPGVNGPKTLLVANTILKRITSEPEVQIEKNIFKLYEVVDNAGNKDTLNS